MITDCVTDDYNHCHKMYFLNIPANLLIDSYWHGLHLKYMTQWFTLILPWQYWWFILGLTMTYIYIGPLILHFKISGTCRSSKIFISTPINCDEMENHWLYDYLQFWWSLSFPSFLPFVGLITKKCLISCENKWIIYYEDELSVK